MLDQRFEIFDLSLDRVRLGVTALAVTAAIVVEHREPLGEAGGEVRRARIEGAVLSRAADQDDRGAVANAVEHDGGAIA